ncbi:MAG: DUF4058 family protein [Chloroflexota bacterium]|nr:DUF4058 family protein [Chloroflexota bacterium]
MPIFADTNLYPGVNAHLNSFLQHEPGGWQSFHAEHLSDIQRAINRALPSGYYTRAEKSLQISITDPDAAVVRSSTTPDVTIFSGRGRAPAAERSATAARPSMLLPLKDVLYDADELMSILIYRAASGHSGIPVTRVELLSPANKRGGTHHEQYLSKRGETIKSGLRLVEIDYLHETPPIIRRIPAYVRSDTDAYPYMILISDPRPSLETGQTAHYGVGVLTPLPIIDVPLENDDSALVDFGVAYHDTFNTSTFYRIIVDYALDPPAFDRYTPDDQAAIRALLERIRAERGT